MNRIIGVFFVWLILFPQTVIAKEQIYKQEANKIFTSALTIILKSKYNLEEINYTRGKAIFTTQTDSYFLEVMQNSKEVALKIEEINSSNQNTQTTINKIFQELDAQYGTK